MGTRTKAGKRQTIPRVNPNGGSGLGKRQSDRSPLLLPALILLAAIVLRMVSITAFDPQFDERITKDVVTAIWHGDWSNNWKHSVSAPDYRFDMYNFSSYFYADAIAAGVPKELADSVTAKTSEIILWSRLFSALTGVAVVYIFYFVAWDVAGPMAAWITMALVAAMPLLVQDSHYARPEPFITALVGMAYRWLLRFDAEPRRLRFLGLAAFCGGVVVACKVSLIPMALVPLVFLLPGKNRARFAPALIAYITCTLAGIFVGVPDAFFHPSAYWHGVEFLRNQYAGAHAPHARIDSSTSASLTASYLWQTLGGLFCLCAIAGMFVLLRARRYVVFAAIAGPVVFYLLYFSLQRTFFERNLSHVAPLMAVLASLALVRLSEIAPPSVRTPALAALVALTIARPLWVSCRLIFVAMPVSVEQRSRDYERAVSLDQQVGVGAITPLLTEGLVNGLVRQASANDGDLLARILDYHDSFTRTYLAELKRRADAREVGYFPSVFEGFDVSTLVTYHGASLRYVLLRPAAPAPRARFVSWSRAGQPLSPGSVHAASWIENGVPPTVRLPRVNTRLYGSFTGAGDSNTGRIELGPFNTSQLLEIGIPVVTGTDSAGLAMGVLNHRDGNRIVWIEPTPVLLGWHLLRVDLTAQHADEIDVVARDGGQGPGEWLAIGWPVSLQPVRAEQAAPHVK
jgi:hypothetical protein